MSKRARKNSQAELKRLMKKHGYNQSGARTLLAYRAARHEASLPVVSHKRVPVFDFAKVPPSPRTFVGGGGTAWLLQVPRDVVVYHIFCHLKMDDLFAATLVCKQLHAAAVKAIEEAARRLFGLRGTYQAMVLYRRTPWTFYKHYELNKRFAIKYNPQLSVSGRAVIRTIIKTHGYVDNLHAVYRYRRVQREARDAENQYVRDVAAPVKLAELHSALSEMGLSYVRFALREETLTFETSSLQRAMAMLGCDRKVVFSAAMDFVFCKTNRLPHMAVAQTLRMAEAPERANAVLDALMQQPVMRTRPGTLLSRVLPHFYRHPQRMFETFTLSDATWRQALHATLACDALQSAWQRPCIALCFWNARMEPLLVHNGMFLECRPHLQAHVERTIRDTWPNAANFSRIVEETPTWTVSHTIIY